MTDAVPDPATGRWLVKRDGATVSLTPDEYDAWKRARTAENGLPANYLAPDGYRYGVMFTDGSVAEYWNGRTQRERAEEYAAKVVADQTAWSGGRHDHITLARQRPGEPWTRVIPPH